MSDDDPFSETDPVEPADESDLETWQRELAQRKRGLDDLADELDEREAELDERERELRTRRTQLDERETELDARAQRIEERETELDDRESAIAERERELADRAEELDETERTLQEYVGDSLRETIHEAVAEATVADDSSHRLGTIGSLILGLVGVTLIVGGVLYGFADQIATVPSVFANDAANLGVTVLLLFSGLAANLAAVAD
jgi:ribonuclease Y